MYLSSINTFAMDYTVYYIAVYLISYHSTCRTEVTFLRYFHKHTEEMLEYSVLTSHFDMHSQDLQ